MIKNKKVQASAGAAATLLAIIAGLILLYILFLPPAERESLLGDNNTATSEGEEVTDNESILLLENPGVIEYVKETEAIHNIPSINLFSEPVSKVLRKQASAIAKRSWFSREDIVLNFKADDLKYIQNVLLSMRIQKAVGEMTITLNGEKIYSGATQNFQPISIEKSLLADDNNLVISVNPPGWRFWDSNKYVINDIQIIAEVLDVSRQESKNTFIITSTEKNSMKEAYLKFVADCETGKVGKLQILINNHEIYSAVPDCDGLNPNIGINPSYLLSGENLLVFKAEKGNFLIDQISVKVKLKEMVHPTYFFNIDDDVYKNIIQNKTRINLTMEFVNDIDTKEAKIIINGIETGLQQEERIFTKKINNFIKKGNNAIEIIPKTTLKILELKVFLW